MVIFSFFIVRRSGNPGSKATIKTTETYLHKQLRSGAPIEQFSDHYAFLDTEEGRLSGLNEALNILQSQLLKYKADQQ